MEPANGIPGKHPEKLEPRESADLPKASAPPEPSLSEPPQEDGLVRFLRRVPMYAFIVFLGVVAADFLFPGVNVVVHNAGPGTMSNVTLGVKGETKPLEPIAEGQEAGVRFRRLTDATLLVNYTDEKGKLHQVDAGYFRFASNSGTLRVRIKNGEVDE